MNVDELFDELTNTVGRFCQEVSGRKIYLLGDNEITKPSGDFITIDLTGSDQMDWQSNDWTDSNGNAVVSHNYQVTYTITAIRGNAQACLSKILQSFNAPYIYDKYFPENSPFAYSSSSSISRLRVPLNLQTYETRAVVLINFNVCFAQVDVGSFEELSTINAQLVYEYPSTTEN